MFTSARRAPRALEVGREVLTNPVFGSCSAEPGRALYPALVAAVRVAIRMSESREGLIVKWATARSFPATITAGLETQ